MNYDILGIIVTVASGIIIPAIALFLSKKDKSIQFVFRANENNNEEFVLCLRNTSDSYIFIDKVKLNKTGFLFWDVSNKFCCPTRMKPGDELKAVFSETELKQILSDALTKVNPHLFFKYKEYRLGFKLTLTTSNGYRRTDWFKIGGSKSNPDRIEIRHYFNYRRYHFNTRPFLDDLGICLMAIGICPIMSIVFLNDSSSDWFSYMVGLTVYIVCMTVIIVESTNGFSNVIHILIISLISSSLPVSMLTNAIGLNLASITLSFFLVASSYGIISRCSGWNM